MWPAMYSVLPISTPSLNGSGALSAERWLTMNRGLSPEANKTHGANSNARPRNAIDFMRAPSWNNAVALRDAAREACVKFGKLSTVNGRSYLQARAGVGRACVKTLGSGQRSDKMRVPIPHGPLSHEA